MPTPQLSIVIPAYNEERRLGSTLSAVFAYLAQQPYSSEVIVSDDGSTDGTVRLVENLQASHPGLRLLRNPHRGKGCTVRAGIQSATGEIVLFSDADISTPIEELANVLPWFERGYEVVIGSRQGEGARRIGEPVLRHIMGRVFNHIVGLVAVSGIRDTQCGFKAFSARAATEIFRSTVIYADDTPAVTGAMVTGFDVEVLFLARKLGYEIREVPVRWNYDADSRVNPIKDSWRNFRDVVAVRWNDLRGHYPAGRSTWAFPHFAKGPACEAGLLQSSQ